MKPDNQRNRRFDFNADAKSVKSTNDPKDQRTIDDELKQVARGKHELTPVVASAINSALADKRRLDEQLDLATAKLNKVLAAVHQKGVKRAVRLRQSRLALEDALLTFDSLPEPHRTNHLNLISFLGHKIRAGTI
jgi:hypothetical protein